MKNITVSVDEETHRRTRIRAAELGTSVSALVRDYLRSLITDGANGASAEEEESETALERQVRLMNEVFEDIRKNNSGFKASDNLPREALYDREAARREMLGHGRRENPDQ